MELRRFALTADISEAHRQVPIDRRDWRYLGCQITAGADVYVHTVGTFGIASASYYWSRVSMAVGRLVQYLAGHRAHTWHLLVADDYHLYAGGQAYRQALIVFFVLCAPVGVPLAWHKTAGGDTVVLDRIRDPAPELQTGNLRAPRVLVHQVDKRDSRLHARTYDEIRRRPWPHNVRCRSPGV